jgi:nitrogen regulatory protein PII
VCSLNLPYIYIAIVSHGQDIKVVKLAHEAGIEGATIIHGTGTSQRGLLCFLGLNETRRDIVFMIAERSIGIKAMSLIQYELQMDKPKHGIMIEMPITTVLGTRKYEQQKLNQSEENHMDHQAIFIIVDKGNAELVIEYACQAGARGGTIINARGAGIHETQKIFNIPIEPEKEIVLIIAENKDVEPITKVLEKELSINEPGKGIIFVMEVSKAIGLYKD